MKQRLEIGGLTFETKEAAKRYTSQLLRSLPFGEVQDEHVRFLLGLVKRHPDYRQIEGCGFFGFEVRQNSWNGILSKGFWAIHRDGTATDFSYRECLSPKTQRAVVMAAFRNEVQYQILRFKQDTYSAEYPCPVTGSTFEFDEADVDHEPPVFVDLVERFLTDRGKTIEDVLVRNGSGVIGSLIMDRLLAQDWREFHQQYARLSLISREGHRIVTRESVAS